MGWKDFLGMDEEQNEERAKREAVKFCEKLLEELGDRAYMVLLNYFDAG